MGKSVTLYRKKGKVRCTCGKMHLIAEMPTLCHCGTNYQIEGNTLTVSFGVYQQTYIIEKG